MKVKCTLIQAPGTPKYKKVLITFGRSVSAGFVLRLACRVYHEVELTRWNSDLLSGKQSGLF